jgi:hypothetical protein
MEGEHWPRHFSQVLVFASHSILLVHMPTHTITNVDDLSRVTAFELDGPCLEFAANSRYSVTSTPTQLKPETDGLLHA